MPENSVLELILVGGNGLEKIGNLSNRGRNRVNEGGMCLSLRHGVVAMAAPRVAPDDPAHGQVAAFQWAVLLQGVDGIMAAGRGISARIGQQGRQYPLIDLHEEYQDAGKELGDVLHSAFFSFFSTRTMFSSISS